MNTSFDEADLQLILDLFEACMVFKLQRLRRQTAIDDFLDVWATRFLQQVQANKFVTRNPRHNTLTWFLEQLVWCRMDRNHRYKHAVGVIQHRILRAVDTPTVTTYNYLFGLA